MEDRRENQPLDYAPAQAKKSRLAMSAFVFGIVSIPLMAFFWVGTVPAFAAVACGAFALRQIDDNPNISGKKEAIAAIILGGIALLLGGLCALSLQGGF